MYREREREREIDRYTVIHNASINRSTLVLHSSHVLSIEQRQASASEDGPLPPWVRHFAL